MRKQSHKKILAWAFSVLALQACTGGPVTKNVPEAQLNDPNRPKLVEKLPDSPGLNPRNPQTILSGDVLDVDFYQEDSLDKTVTVDRSGRILLPLIGPVRASGRSVSSLASGLEERYRDTHLQAPEISVFITSTIQPQVTVDGAVVKPGVYTVSERSTLLQLIATVGGFTKTADPTKVFVFRDSKGKKLVANYSVRAIREGLIPDLRIYEGDTIVAFDSTGKVTLQNVSEALGVAAVFASVGNAVTN